jgi:uncharacterized protein YegL
MSKVKNIAIAVVGVIAVSGYFIVNTALEDESVYAPAVDMGQVDWSAIATWPPLNDLDEVESLPDPNRTFTVIILDDSGSMGSDIDPAKQAVLQAVRMMSPNDRVGVLALNAGELLSVTAADEASDLLPSRLSPVYATGSTPLGAALAAARDLLSEEAARARAFGTYRVIITTDGAADDPDRLIKEVAQTVNTTPIQVATIGIGIGPRHVLNAAGHTSYVAVDNVDKLSEALQAAVAENPDFAPITAFGEDN